MSMKDLISLLAGVFLVLSLGAIARAEDQKNLQAKKTV
jgi:hypothetical protein